MIDIQKLLYLQSIAENEFNITKAASKLYISQPALSKTISSMEAEENLEIFIRDKGRIISFTSRGKKLYEESKILINYYYNMLENVHSDKGIKKENIRIAAPPIILTVYLSKILPNLNKEFPDVTFSYYEGNNIEVREGILNKKYDVAIMTKPTNYNMFCIKEKSIDTSVFTAYISKNHPLSNKSILTWKDITKYPITIPGKNYSTYSLIWNAAKMVTLSPKIILSSSLWEFQINVVMHSDAISILPKFVKNLFNHEMEENILRKDIDLPPPWEVCVCKAFDQRISNTVNKIYDYIVNSFEKDKSLCPFGD